MPTITAVSGPIVNMETTNSPVQAAARERAIAKMLGSQVSPAPTAPRPVAGHQVSNQSAISPEEAVGVAAAAKAAEGTEIPTESVQDTTTEGQVASDATEASPEAIKAKPEDEPQLSSQYAQLARQTKAFRAQVTALKAEQSALKAERDAMEAEKVRMKSDFVPKERLTKDTLKVLQEQGFSAEQITNMMLNAPSPEDVKHDQVIEELRAEINALKADSTATKQSNEENQRNAYQQAVNTIRTEARQLVASDPQFETIQATDSIEDVVELITKTHAKEGKLLTVQEAATAVEEYLEEEALKLAKLKKIQAKLKAAPTATKEPAGSPTAAKTPTKTLTSTMTTSRPLTARERAIARFNGDKL